MQMMKLHRHHATSNSISSLTRGHYSQRNGARIDVSDKHVNIIGNVTIDVSLNDDNGDDDDDDENDDDGVASAVFVGC